MRLTIVDRYILREIVQVWVAVTAVLVLILATNSLAYMLGKVVEGELAGDVVTPLFLTQFVNYFVTLIPLGMYLGLLIAFGRLYAESEMAALGACGIGLKELYRPVAVVGLVGAAITAGLSVWASPWASRAEVEIQQRMAERSELTGIAPGRFNRAGGGLVLFAERKPADDVLEGVFLEATGPDGETHLVRARTAVEHVDDDTGWRFLEFRSGYRYTGDPGSARFREVAFRRHGVRLGQDRGGPVRLDEDGKSMAQLWASDELDDAAELQWRISLPIACFLLALFALPLSHTTPRQGRYGKIALGLLVYIVYSNILVIAEDAVDQAAVPVEVGMWWSHLVLIAAIVALLAYRLGPRWLLAVIRSGHGAGP